MPRTNLVNDLFARFLALLNQENVIGSCGVALGIGRADGMVFKGL